MFLEKLLLSIPNFAEPQGVCVSCNGSTASISVEPNRIRESNFMSRYNTMRHVENQGKGCPT